MAKSDIQMFRARTSEVEIEFMDDQIQSFDSETTFWNYGLLNRSNNDILNQKMDKSDKIPVSTFESMFEKFLKWNFVFMGRRLRKFSLKLRKLRARENWIRIELDLNPINENFILKILNFRHFKNLKLRLLILNDWIISTIKWIWLLLIRSTNDSFCIYITVSMRSNHWVLLFQKYDHPRRFYVLAVIRNQIVP